jgi:zinc/manganese transport system substrate-binding protein
MKMVRFWIVLVLSALPISVTYHARADDSRIEVVATFSILADLVANVGGERVRVTSLVGPGSDAHVFQATPSDAVALKRARVVVENGLGFEGWLDRLIETSGYAGPKIVASKGIPVRDMARGEAHEIHHAKEEERHRESGFADPHAWQNIANAIAYVETIKRGLCAADPEGCPEYEANASAYATRLHAMESEIKQRLSRIPAESRKVITSHDAFGYFGDAYDIEILAPEGTSTEQEASAKDVARLIRQIREQDIKALFVENISDPRLIEQIARETGLHPAGRLYSDALSPKGGPADTYIAMMRHNASAIAGALEDVERR